MKYYLVNWRNQSKNGLEKAIALMQEPKVDLNEINEHTNISLAELKKYHTNPKKLNEANWFTVNRLMQMYDIYKITESTNHDDYMLVFGKINDMFDVLCKKFTKEPERIVIKDMKKIVTTDPLAMYLIYSDLIKHYYATHNDEDK